MYYPNLERAILDAKSYDFENYHFRIFDFGEKGQHIPHALMSEIVDGMSLSITTNFPEFDYIVAPEPGGHTWGMLVSLKMAKSINVLRVLPSKLPGELEIPRKTPYNEGHLYINYVQKGDRVIIIDDVIFRGGTLASIIKALQEQGVLVVGVQTILAKTKKYILVEREYGVPIKALVQKDFMSDNHLTAGHREWQ